MIKVPITLLFTKQDYQILVKLASERGFIFKEVYGRLPKNKDDLDRGAVKDSINNLVRDYLDKQKALDNVSNSSH